MQVENCLVSASEWTKTRLAAGLRLDPLGELIALPQTPLLDLWRRERGEGKGEEKG